MKITTESTSTPRSRLVISNRSKKSITDRKMITKNFEKLDVSVIIYFNILKCCLLYSTKSFVVQ